MHRGSFDTAIGSDRGILQNLYIRLVIIMRLFLTILLFLASGICLAQTPGLPPIETTHTGGVRAEQQMRLWNLWSRRPARQIELTAAQRIDGLSRLRAEVMTERAHFERAPQLDWDSLFQAMLPVVAAPQTPVEYYRTLQSIAALLQDGGTRVIVPWELRDSLELHPPIITRLVEDRVFVGRAYDRDLAERGVVAGVELLSVDGIPVLEYGRCRVMPYVSASTEQGRLSGTFERALLAGSGADSVTLELRRPDGSTFSERFARNWNAEPLFSLERSVSGELLEGNIGYLRINTFFDEYLPGYVRRQFAPLAGSDALIIDLRENEDGSPDVALEILEIFTGGSHPGISPDMASLELVRHASVGTLDGGKRSLSKERMFRTSAYDKPIVILTSPRTRSAAEDFVALFRDAGRGRVLGERTAGTACRTCYVALPGDGLLEVCATGDPSADGSAFNGIGIIPDIEVAPRMGDLEAGIDRALDAAVDLLRR